MSEPLRGELGRAYAVAAIGTVAVGAVGLTVGVDTDVIAQLVSLSALVVCYINLYWLIGGRGSY